MHVPLDVLWSDSKIWLFAFVLGCATVRNRPYLFVGIPLLVEMIIRSYAERYGIGPVAHAQWSSAVDMCTNFVLVGGIAFCWCLWRIGNAKRAAVSNLGVADGSKVDKDRE